MRKRIKHNGERTQFKPGHKPWNKNVKGIHLSRESEFKKGQIVGINHPSWAGGVQYVKNDCVHINLGPNKRGRRPRLVYERAYGKIPKGYVIWHKNGNKDDDRLENLSLISRAELLRLNSIKGNRISE